MSLPGYASFYIDIDENTNELNIMDLTEYQNKYEKSFSKKEKNGKKIKEKHRKSRKRNKYK